MTNVVREINLYLNTRERNPPSTIARPATICTWALDMPIVLKSPENYFQISVRGFHADAGLVPAPYINTKGTYNQNDPSTLSDNWVRFHNVGHNHTSNLPTGYWTNEELCNWLSAEADAEYGAPAGSNALGGKLCVYDAVSGRSLWDPNGNLDPTAISIDFSATLWKAFGWGVQYGVLETPNGGPPPGDTSQYLYTEKLVGSYYPMSAIRDRTLFVLYNAGPKDSFSVSTSAYRTYDESAGNWTAGNSGQLKEKRCIAAISLLPFYRPVAPIEFTAQNLTFTALTASCIDNITLELATENWPVVPLPVADYTIILCIQECTPIAQTQPGIPQPIVLPKKSDEEKQKNDKGGDNEEYIRQLAQQIKKRRLERAADRVEQSGSLAE